MSSRSVRLRWLDVFPLLALLLAACSAPFASGTVGSPDADRFEQDLALISAAPRVPGDPHHSLVQNLCASTFEQLGFEVEYQDFTQGVNVIGVQAGQGESGEYVLISAHYDTTPGCNGADDNASGVAGVLESARLLAGRNFDWTLMLACWDAEERGLLGSRAFARRAAERGDKIALMYNFEMIGYRSLEPGSQQIPPGVTDQYPEQTATREAGEGAGDYIALIYDRDATAAVDMIVERADLLDLPTRALAVDLESGYPRDFRRSDHAPFWDQGYPAVMITDTANFRNPNYHCIHGEDAFGTLDLEFALNVVEAVTVSTDSLLSGRLPEP